MSQLIQKFRNPEISTKITLGYAACFFSMLVLINMIMWLGIMTALYEPAEQALAISMTQTKTVLEELERDYDSYKPETFRGCLIAGVVLRVTDSKNDVFIDTDSNYPSIEEFDKNKLKVLPIFADDSFEIAQINGALIYRGIFSYEHEGESFTLNFFVTITSELDFLDDLEKGILLVDIFGMTFALLFGYLLSRKILSPIKTMNELARGIAFENLNGRIPINTANDELSELAKTLNRMLDRLQGGINRQQKFVSDSSHELRQPATVFLGYVNLLESGDPELVKEATEAIRSEAYNMQKLLENISFFSRIDQKRLKLNKKSLDLEKILEEVVRKLQISDKTHKIVMSNNSPAKIYGDESAIKQMIRVFLENAIKYTPNGGDIRINSVTNANKVFLSIRDSGIGIAPENQEKIFERYFRIRNDNYEQQGSGLGLAMAKTIADIHKIKISVESELNKGSTFILKIPIYNEN